MKTFQFLIGRLATKRYQDKVKSLYTGVFQLTLYLFNNYEACDSDIIATETYGTLDVLNFSYLIAYSVYTVLEHMLKAYDNEKIDVKFDYYQLREMHIKSLQSS